MKDKKLLEKNGLDVIEVSIENNVPVFKVKKLQLKNEKRGNYRRVLLFDSIVLKEPEESHLPNEEYTKQKECFDRGLPFVRPIGMIVHNEKRYYAEEKQEPLNEKVIRLLKEEKYEELRTLNESYDVLVKNLSYEKLGVDIKIPNILYPKNNPTKFVLTDAFTHTKENYPRFTELLPNVIHHAFAFDKLAEKDVSIIKRNIKKYCHSFDFPCPPLED